MPLNNHKSFCVKPIHGDGVSITTSRTPRRFGGFRQLGLIAAVGGSLALGGTLAAAEADLYRWDPAKVQGAENCAECHAPMVEAWKLTHHYSTYYSTHQGDAAKQILSKLGIRRMKAESLCVKCHYTSQGSDQEIKTISGTSCESCHSAAADWNKAHSDKDDPQRLVKAEKLGLLRPANIYAVAANCFSCHTVPEEKLVNVGGHTAGSAFELVSWLQGEVRHNLQKSAGKVNPEAPPARARMLYVVGRALDLEYGLRGLAKATQAGKYAESMAQRVEAAKSKLKEAFAVLKDDDLKQILDSADGAQLKPNNAEGLTQAADKVGAAARKFASSHDGSTFAALDPLLPRPEQFKGNPHKP
jgi:hypothetical protein